MSSPIIPLSLFLRNAKTLLTNLITVENGISFIKIRQSSGLNGKLIEIKLPLITPAAIDLDVLFDVRTFLNNYFNVFQTTFPQLVMSHVTSIEVHIVNDLAGISTPATITSFFSFQFNLFRQMLCIFFNMFKIDLIGCVCIPSTYSELVLFRSGTGTNCYKLECAQAIKQNPRAFDPVFCASNCEQQICMQAIIVNVLSGGNTTVNIDAKQQCETIINTVNTSNTSNN